MGVLLSLSLQRSIAAESPGLAIVAGYSTELQKNVGNRTCSILRANKIECMTVTGRGTTRDTLWVPANQASEARQLLAQAIKAEKLHLTLFARIGVVVTPDSILESKKDQRAE